MKGEDERRKKLLRAGFINQCKSRSQKKRQACRQHGVEGGKCEREGGLAGINYANV